MGAARSKLTAAENAATADLSHQTVLVTGSSTGIGLETSRVLASRGGRVIMAARDRHKNEAAIQLLLTDPTLSSKGGSLIPMSLDLSSLSDVRRFAEEFIAKDYPLHLLILNAGVMACPLSSTVDGIEMQLGTNHVGHFYLTKLLMPVLQRTALTSHVRVIALTSRAHTMHPWIDYTHLPLPTAGQYDKWGWYGQSKWANILFAYELNQRFHTSNISAHSVHPGVINTPLYRHAGYGGAFFTAVAAPFMKNVPQGAASTVFAALSTEAVGEGAGQYIADSQVNPGIVKKIKTGEAATLWEWTEQLIQAKTNTSPSA